MKLIARYTFSKIDLLLALRLTTRALAPYAPQQETVFRWDAERGVLVVEVDAR